MTFLLPPGIKGLTVFLNIIWLFCLYFIKLYDEVCHMWDRLGHIRKNRRVLFHTLKHNNTFPGVWFITCLKLVSVWLLGMFSIHFSLFKNFLMFIYLNVFLYLTFFRWVSVISFNLCAALLVLRDSISNSPKNWVCNPPSQNFQILYEWTKCKISVRYSLYFWIYGLSKITLVDRCPVGKVSRKL